MVNFLPPVAEGIVRPLWSVMIPTYNCANYTKETLESVLQQDPGPDVMQIEVIDDCSTDNIEEVVRTVGKGRVGFFKQPHNVGHIKNFETALGRSKGKVIHLLHGDDRVLWGFYAQMAKLFYDHPAIGGAFCRHYYMDKFGDQIGISSLVQSETGVVVDFFDRMVRGNLVQTPSVVVKRAVYEAIGMFDKRLVYTEDYEMWTRIAKHYSFGYCKSPLAEYRMFGSSHTGRTMRSRKGLEDLQLAFQLIRKMCDGDVKALKRHHNNITSQHELNFANQLLKENAKREALVRMMAVMRFEQSFKLRLKWMWLLVRAVGRL